MQRTKGSEIGVRLKIQPNGDPGWSATSWLVRTAAAAIGTVTGTFWLVLWFNGKAVAWSAAGMITPKTNTALAMTLCGLALWLVNARRLSQMRSAIAAACAGLVLLIGAVTFVENLSGWNLGIDQLLAMEPPGMPGVESPNRMGIPASVSFALLGLGVLAAAGGRHTTASYLGLTVCVFTLVPMMGYFYGIPELHEKPRFTAIAWPTVIGVLALAIGLLLVHGAGGPVELLARNDPGGRLLRHMLPAALLFPVLLGYLEMIAERAGVLDSAVRTALVVIVLALAFSAMLWGSAVRLSRSAAAEKEASEAQHESETRFKALFEQSMDGIYAICLERKLIMANPATERITGYTFSELKSVRFLELCTGECREPAARAFDQVLSGEPATVELSIRRKDGEVVDLVLSASPMMANSQIEGAFGVIRDITDRKRTEQALRESEEIFRTVYEHAAVGIEMLDLEGHILRCNEALCQILGYTEQELKQHTYLDITHPDYREHELEMVRQLLAKEIPSYSYEKCYLHRDGHGVWVRITSSLAWTDTPYRITVIEDITERKKAEHELRRRTRSVQLLSDSATRLLMEDRPELVITRLFDELAAHLGFEVYLNYLITEGDNRHLRLNASAGLDMHALRALHDLELDETVCGQVARTGQRIVVEDIQQTDDARVHLLRSLGVRSYACHPLQARGRLIGTLSFGSTHRDFFTQNELRLLQAVSDQVAMALERRRLVDELERRAKELADAKTSAERAKTAAEEANQAKDHFLAVLSHELRTPLTPVMTAAQLMLGESGLIGELRELTEMIRRNVELEARLIDDLLDLTRISRGKLQLHLSNVDIHEKLQHVVAMCEPDMEPKHLDLRIELQARNYYVQADAARLQQVFWNLLKNAVKFTQPGGKITVRTSNPKMSAIAIEVEDTGAGIEPGMLPRIFNAFEQGGQETTRQFGGLGLGLAISKSLVTLHKGTITAWSAGPGTGATFTVTLPITTTAQVSTQARGTPEKEDLAVEPHRRLLLVEDHADTAMLLARVLGKNDDDVRVALSVKEALELARNEQFDLLISDIGLPDGTGLELMEQLRHDLGLHLKGIALSGYGMEEDMRRSREAGFEAHLVKPVNIEELKAVIGRLLANQE